MSPDNCKHHHRREPYHAAARHPEYTAESGAAQTSPNSETGPRFQLWSAPWHVCAFQHDPWATIPSSGGQPGSLTLLLSRQTEETGGGTYLFACLLIAGFSWAGLVLGPREIDLRPEPAVCSPGKTLPRPRSQGKDLVGRAMGNVISEYHRQLACPREQQQREGGGGYRPRGLARDGTAVGGDGIDQKAEYKMGWMVFCVCNAVPAYLVLQAYYKFEGVRVRVSTAGGQGTALEKKGRAAAGVQSGSFVCLFVRSFVRPPARGQRSSPSS